MDKLNKLSKAIQSTQTALSELELVQTHLECEDLMSALRRVRRLNELLVAKKKSLLVAAERKTSPYQFQWSWWLYEKNRTETSFPWRVQTSSAWHNYEIDAVMAACTAFKLGNNRQHFPVHDIQQRTAFPSELGFAIKHCEIPYGNDGSIPTMTPPLSRIYDKSSDMMDAIYAVYKESLTWDQPDGPKGPEFIVLETCGI